ncbi:polysaccharide deacetylase family protein [Nocardioides montaniterrae]
MSALPDVRVLMYHGVERMDNERDPHGMFVCPDDFERQIGTLLEAGYTPISEDEYIAALDGASVPRGSVLITFDDGYRSVAERAAPILDALDAPSVLYVPSGLVGGESAWLPEAQRHPILGADELADLASVGMSIGVHGYDHADLTSLGDDDLRRHTADSLAEIGRLVGREPRSFAHPFGAHDSRVRRAVKDAGYAAAFAVHDARGPYAVPRVDVNATDTALTFRLKLRRSYPLARRISGRVPGVRRRVHDLLGRAQRGDDDRTR